MDRRSDPEHRLGLPLPLDWYDLGHSLSGVMGRLTAMASDRLPVGSEPEISEELRRRGIVFVQGLFADGRVDQNTFQQAVDGLLAVHMETDFASLMRSLPPL